MTLSPLRKFWKIALPERIKEILFRGSFSIMEETTQDYQRERYQMASMEWSLRQLKRCGYTPDAILDIGAYKGAWTKLTRSIFPESKILMIEAQEERKNILHQICQESPGETSYIISALSSENKENVPFFRTQGGKDDTTGSSLFAEKSNVPRTEVELTTRTLDSLLQEGEYPTFSFAKLDVQGAEKEVLLGAEETLKTLEVILLETSLLRINEGAPLLHELIAFLSERGFLPYDICSLMRRPEDKVLAQTDIIFVRENSPLLKNQSITYGT